MSARLRLELSPSPWMGAVIMGLHGAAAVCVLLVARGVAGALLAAALFALGMASARVRALLASPQSIRAIELDGEAAGLELRNGSRLAAPVGARRYVSRLVVSLSFGAPVRRTVLVSRDMLSAESFRLLRLWALWGKLPAVAAKQLVA